MSQRPVSPQPGAATGAGPRPPLQAASVSGTANTLISTETPPQIGHVGLNPSLRPFKKGIRHPVLEETQGVSSFARLTL